MDLMLKLVPDSVQNWIIICAILAAIAAVIKWLPAWVDTKLATGIDAIFGALGPDEDWLFVQFLIYLERKYGKYANADKAREAVDKLLTLLPVQYRVFAGEKVRAKLYELVTKIFESAKARIEKEAQEHAAPPVVPKPSDGMNHISIQ